MVLFKREVRLWQETNVTQRALMIGDDADFAWLALKMQHDRVVDGAHPLPGEDARLPLFYQKADVDFFFVALHRLVVTAELAQEVADPRRVMPDAMRTFSHETSGMMLSEAEEPATVASVRHALEHGQNLERRGGLGFARAEEGWYVSYRDRMFDTKQLFEAGRRLHRAIRQAVDPEAFADFRGQHPIVQLHDPAGLSTR